MRAGRLRRFVTIEQKVAGSPAQDSAGNPLYTWQTFAQVYAAVEPLRGMEFFQAEQRQIKVDTRVVTRYRAGVTEQMRVVDGADVFNIEGVIDTDTRHVELQLMCVKGVGGG
jgi:SPP1 family predicted phage head-tail adaptor